MTTVLVDGPYEFRVTSDNESIKFTNVRFEISGGASFFFGLAVEEIPGTATFTGITGMVSSPHGKELLLYGKKNGDNEVGAQFGAPKQNILKIDGPTEYPICGPTPNTWDDSSCFALTAPAAPVES